jgi:cation:H+ antiporter
MIVFGELLVGLVFLVAGAELLVKGASKLALSLGISPLLVGLTIVAYGTSAPEMAVSIQSSLAGQADIALGNVVGSNIFNVLVILGLSAMIVPLVVNQQLIRLDVPLMIGLSILTLFFGIDGRINPSDGVILFLGAIIYTVFLFYQSNQEKNCKKQEYPQANLPLSLKQWIINISLIVGGLALLVLGCNFLIESSLVIARALGVSELIIGLTIVAAGTSLPELATSVVASMRNERDIAVGNVVGSNIFNILAVLGLSAAISPTGITVPAEALNFDLPVMIAVALGCLPIFFTGGMIERWEGFLFFAYYVVYTIYLFLYSTQHDSLPIFSKVMIGFVIPITVLTLGILTFNTFKEKRKKRDQIKNS